jgi:hypothetical protein
MEIKKTIKHSKIRNTGLLFEFLLREITADILDKRSNSPAVDVIKKRFNEKTELGRELLLYNVLLNKKFSTDKKADFFIFEVLERRNRLNRSILKREKYNLIKKLKENFDLNRLLSSKVKSYKVYASIYKLFEFSDSMSPDEKTETHFNLVEHVTTKESVSSNVISENLPKDEDIRALSYKILLEKFNRKYSNLNFKQKSLLKAYINNVSNTNSLKEHIEKEIVLIKKELKKYLKSVDDKITKIKLAESIKSIDTICKLNSSKNVEDKPVVQLMRYYELAKELKKHA